MYVSIYDLIFLSDTSLCLDQTLGPSISTNEPNFFPFYEAGTPRSIKIKNIFKSIIQEMSKNILGCEPCLFHLQYISSPVAALPPFLSPGSSPYPLNSKLQLLASCLVSSVVFGLSSSCGSVAMYFSFQHSRQGLCSLHPILVFLHLWGFLLLFIPLAVISLVELPPLDNQ